MRHSELSVVGYLLYAYAYSCLKSCECSSPCSASKNGGGYEILKVVYPECFLVEEIKDSVGNLDILIGQWRPLHRHSKAARVFNKAKAH